MVSKATMIALIGYLIYESGIYTHISLRGLKRLYNRLIERKKGPLDFLNEFNEDLDLEFVKNATHKIKKKTKRIQKIKKYFLKIGGIAGIKKGLSNLRGLFKKNENDEQISRDMDYYTEKARDILRGGNSGLIEELEEKERDENEEFELTMDDIDSLKDFLKDHKDEKDEFIE